MKRIISVLNIFVIITFSSIAKGDLHSTKLSKEIYIKGSTLRFLENFELEGKELANKVDQLDKLEDKSYSTSSKKSTEIKENISEPINSMEVIGKIEGQSYYAFKLDRSSGVIEEVIPFAGNLTNKAKEGINKAPCWMRDALRDNLGFLPPSLQDKYADLILSPPDERYRDEIAFAIAYLSKSELESDTFSPSIIVENAKYIYENDIYLDYVEVVDYGTSDNDEDYYSTTRYKLLKDGIPFTYELPKEYYYFYIVHPKLSDEPVRYIDPQTGKIASPPKGKFWRSYLFYDSDNVKESYVAHFVMKYPNLISKEELQNWNPSSFGYFTEMAIAPLEIVKIESQKPSLIEFTLGSGTIIATMMPVEIGYQYGYSRLLENLLEYGNGDIILPSSSPILIFKDKDPWEKPTEEEVLIKNGRTYTVLTSSEIANIDLSQFKKIIIPSDQPYSLYKTLSENRTKFEEWVQNGGVFEFHGASRFEDDWAGLIMPGGFTTVPQEENLFNEVIIGGHPLLKDVLSKVEYLWDGKRYDALSGDRPFSNKDFALDTIGNWVGKNMFDNVAEHFAEHGEEDRSIEPVRIVYNHWGNCGELQDLLGGASRAALIPNISTTNLCEDHVWNEFWYDGSWHYYQVDWSCGPTRIDTPGGGQDKDYGGGKDTSVIFNWRGDGYIYNVSERYSKTVTLNVLIVDREEKPVDGARVLILSDGPGRLILPCYWDVTNNKGELTIKLGDLQNYYIQVQSPFGDIYPSPTRVVQVINAQDATAGTSFNWTHKYMQEVNRPQIFLSPNEEKGKSYYLVNIKKVSINEFEYGKNLFTGDIFREILPGGNITLFIFDEKNYQSFSKGVGAIAEHIEWDISELSYITYLTSHPSNLYFVLSNKDYLTLGKKIDFKINLYKECVNGKTGECEEIPCAFVLPHNSNYSTTLLILTQFLINLPLFLKKSSLF